MHTYINDRIDNDALFYVQKGKKKSMVSWKKARIIIVSALAHNNNAFYPRP